MPKEYLPELTNYLDKMVSLKLNANRQVSGTLIGFDTFMNIVLDNAFEELHDGDRNNIGKVVCSCSFSQTLIFSYNLLILYLFLFP